MQYDKTPESASSSSAADPVNIAVGGNLCHASHNTQTAARTSMRTATAHIMIDVFLSFVFAAWMTLLVKVGSNDFIMWLTISLATQLPIKRMAAMAISKVKFLFSLLSS